MDSLSIEQLRQMQSSLNTAIEVYVTASQSLSTQAVDDKEAAAHEIGTVARKLYHATRDPYAEAHGLGLRPLLNVVARVAIELNLFEFITEATSIDELVAKSGAEKRLLVRVLRPLVAERFIDQPTETTYSSTAISRSLNEPRQQDWTKTCFDFCQPIWQQIPLSIRQSSYRDVTSVSANPSILAYGANFFEALCQQPEQERAFASAMGVQDVLPAEILPQYPFDQDVEALPTSNPSTIMIVDVGGGNGRFLARINKSFPTLAKHGKNVLQDIESVINAVPKSYQADNNFTAHVHNFFKDNPVKGARYYNLRGVLHDWPDHQCREILLGIRSAMTPSYSKVLIQGFIMKEVGYGAYESLLDINMMMCAGRERTRKDYEELLGGCGLRIERVAGAQKGDWTCIEAVIDESWKGL